MSVDQAPEPGHMTRDQLEAEVEELRQLREVFGTIGDVDLADADFQDFTIAGVPIGRVINNMQESAREREERIEALERGETDAEGSLTENVRQRLLPIHEMWMDVREGREQKIPSSSNRRGARLFGAMIQKASGENVVGVDATYGKYKITSKRARQMLEEAGDMTDSGKTMTVKRAMKAAQSASKTEDCECDTLESCDHGLVVWENKNSHTLTADKDAFNAEMRSVQEAVEGEIGATTDDEGNSSEETGDETSAFDQLDQATAVTGDEEDTVESEVANDVVSRSKSRPLGGGQTPNRDTSQTR